MTKKSQGIIKKISKTGRIFCAGKNAKPSQACKIQNPTKRMYHLNFSYLVWEMRNEGLTKLKKGRIRPILLFLTSIIDFK